ncbi:MAG: glycosyltransferase family 39 protein [Anaerolineales bacterium]|nr:glycosyltransferase family 39 protein [Anaerolineales bacterium]
MNLVTPLQQIRRRLNKADQVEVYLVSLSGLILLFTLAIRIYISQTSGLMYDEPVTLHLAKAVASGQLPFKDFYEHHSLLPWYLLAPLSDLSLWQIQRLCIGVAGVLALIGLYRLGSSLWGLRAGLFVIIFGTVSPLWQHQGTMIIHDSFLVVTLTVALLVWWYALKRSSILLWVLAGICAGLVVHSKQTGILSVIALCIGVLVFTRSVKPFLAFAFGGFLTLIPLVLLYWDQYDLLFNGLMGWNLAANTHLPGNPKFKPFFNDIFLANPVLWGVGGVTAIWALRHLRHRFKPGDKGPLMAVAGLIVIFVLVFNWFLSKQTFNQYYLQAVPALILLAALALDKLFKRPLPFWAKVGLGVALIYLGIINPLANAMVPWTPDLQEKLNIANWIQEEVDDQEIWEPWVYYAHLAEKEFNFNYPFLSIHSVRDDPDLPTIDGQDNIDLDGFILRNGIRWIIVHHPLMPGIDTYLDRRLTTGEEDWQLIRSFQVTRYASESGMQHHFWTPWWKPLIIYETVSVWYRHPGTRHGGLVGEIKIQNPIDLPNLYMQVQHPGGIDVYQLDDRSTQGKDYTLNWHQTGHAFFLSEGPHQIDHKKNTNVVDAITLTIAFSSHLIDDAQQNYQLRIPMNQEKEYCIDCVESWKCTNWPPQESACELIGLEDIFSLSAVHYDPVKDLIIENTFPDD